MSRNVRSLDLRRVAGPWSTAALALLILSTTAAASSTVVAGRLAESASGLLVAVFALLVIGGVVVENGALVAWSAVVDRAEGRLRSDLVDVVLAQPLAAASEQAVGEVLDRVDDDTHQVGTLLRRDAWQALRTLAALAPLWIVAGLTWTPAFVLVPVGLAGVFAVVRSRLAEISERKVVEEAAWTDHAAMIEEGIAARDDIRASLGQPFVVRRTAELAAEVHRRFARVMNLEAGVGLVTGLLLHALLAGVAVAGVLLVDGGRLGVAELVTLFLVFSQLVGQADAAARHLPELQSGLGAVLRLRGLLASPAEPAGGADLPAGDLGVSLRGLHFAYPTGDFALRELDLEVPPGATLALVGRTGSGKSTLVSLLSRAADPPAGTVFLGGADITAIELGALRREVGVVTQRTELLAATLAENITLFAPVPPARVEAAVAELGLTDWVAGLPQGMDTPLGPGGTTLSAGEEQLVAFARLLVRDVRVVVLDEATARMDPVTEARVVAASSRLLRGRTGVLVAHRLATTDRADLVAVMDRGRIVQHGPRDELARTPGPFADLVRAAARENDDAPRTAGASAGSAPRTPPGAASESPKASAAVSRQQAAPPAPPVLAPTPTLVSATWQALMVRRLWGIASVPLFLLSAATGAFGAVTAWLWGDLVAGLQAGEDSTRLLVAVAVSLLVAPFFLSGGIWLYPRWWVEVLLRVRNAVLVGQTRTRRLRRDPPGEIVGRALDADRYVHYCDLWVDLTNGVLLVVLTAVLAGEPLAGLVPASVLIAAAAASWGGRAVAGRSETRASTTRAGFGRSLVSVLESLRTIKLAGATAYARGHLADVDAGRVEAAVTEHRVRALLDAVPRLMVQAGAVAAWLGLLLGWWGLPTALLLASSIAGFEFFGRVAGAVVTQAPGTRAWIEATSAFSGGGQLVDLPAGVDLVAGSAPAPAALAPVTRSAWELRELTSVHDDGTVGVRGVSLALAPGELVLLLGPVGSGKSSVLAAMAGLVSWTGDVCREGAPITDAERLLRPPHVAYVAQVPRVLSGAFADNVALDHDRQVAAALTAARLDEDVAAAGGPTSRVGHRGVRLSGGQVQRLALARALACEPDLLLADDVSSALDAATEVELWESLRARGGTVLASTSKRAALARADRVVVLDAGEVAAVGRWSDLEGEWGHLAG